MDVEHIVRLGGWETLEMCDVRVQVVDLSPQSITFDAWSSQLLTVADTGGREGGSILTDHGSTYLSGNPAYFMNYRASEGPDVWQGKSVWAQFGTEGFLACPQ